MANFYQKETRTLRMIFANPNPIPVTVKVTRGLANSFARWAYVLPPKTDNVIVPASAQSAPVDMVISFATVPPGMYYGWCEIWDAETNQSLGNFITEDTYILAQAITLVKIIWV